MEQVVGKDACLRKTIAATADFKIDPAVMVTPKEGVFCDEFVGNVRYLDADIIQIRYGRVQIEVLQVNCAEASTLFL